MPPSRPAGASTVILMMDTPKARVILRPGRDKSLLRRHPWIFSGAIERIEGDVQSGVTVEVLNAQRQFVAWAAYSPQSQIRLRVWSFDRHETVDETFFRRRLERAIEARRKLGWLEADAACRLVFGEADGLPGLIVDRYADHLSCQFLAAGVERWRETLTGLLIELVAPAGIYERSESAARRKEGLASRQQVLYGDPAVARIVFREGRAQLTADLVHGQKTGAYLDQRVNRGAVADYARGARMLDAFAFSGAFSTQCLLAGADAALLLDSSSEAAAAARGVLEANGVAARAEVREVDVFGELRNLRERQERFDLVVLDPPKFVHQAAQLTAGTRGYKDINWLGAGLVRSGGLLATFSCSGHVDAALFQKIVAGAVLDAGRSAQIVEGFGQAADHPVALEFPESAYLKGLLLRIW